MRLDAVIRRAVAIAAWPWAGRLVRPGRLDALLLSQGRLPAADLARALSDDDTAPQLAPHLDLDTTLAEVERRTAAALQYPWAPLAALLARLSALGEVELALVAIEGQPPEARFEVLRTLIDALPPDLAAPRLAEMVAYAAQVGSIHALLAVLPRLDAAARRALVAQTVGLDASGHEEVVATWLAQDTERSLAEACAQAPYPRAITLAHLAFRQTDDTPDEARLALAEANLALAELPPSSQPYPSWRLQAFQRPIPGPLRERALQLVEALEPAERVYALLCFAAHTDGAVLERAVAESRALTPPHRARAAVAIAEGSGRHDPEIEALVADWPALVGHPDWPVAADLWPGRSLFRRVDLWTLLASHAPAAEQRRLTDRALEALELDLEDQRQQELVPLRVACAKREPSRLASRVLADLDRISIGWEQRARILIELGSESLAAQLARVGEGGRQIRREEARLIEALDAKPELRQIFACDLLDAASRSADPQHRRELWWTVAEHARGDPQASAFGALWSDGGAWEPPATWFAQVVIQRPDLVDLEGLRRVWDHTRRSEPYYDPMTHLSRLCPLFPEAEARGRRAEVIAGLGETMHLDFQDSLPPFEALAPQLDASETRLALRVVAEQPHAGDWHRDSARHALLLRQIALGEDPAQIAREAPSIADPVLRSIVELALPHPDPEALLQAMLARLPEVLEEERGYDLERFASAVSERLPGDERLALALAEGIDWSQSGRAAWRALAAAALLGGSAERAAERLSRADPDVRARLWIALLAAAAPDEPRIGAWVCDLLDLVDRVSEETLEAWTPAPGQLREAPADGVVRWLERALTEPGESVHDSRRARQLLIEWLPALHDRFGSALLDEILLAADQRPEGLPSTHTSG